VFKCDDGIPVGTRAGGGWLGTGTWSSSEELSIESTGEACGELSLDSEKSSLNTSGFDSLEIEGLCDRDGRDTDDSRDSDGGVAMMIVLRREPPSGVIGREGLPAARNGVCSRL
jgi:hypothetical protein